MERAQRSFAGRPEATSHAEIEQVAFRLFAERGFERTTLDAIAEAVGVSRRTLFRYFASKNDIPWGQFDRTLEHFRELLDAMPQELPIGEAVHRGVMAFNEFPADADPSHRERMRLILGTPTLQAHSVLRYREWRQVIEEYVAARRGEPVDALVPRMVGQVSLALAVTAYDIWLESDQADLQGLLARLGEELRDLLAD
ncbi:mycofactocin system transcriptional regulator [Nocardioides alcanivorans]|uniref:mycofactocin system transcriptional regulator n=1 Tax=Nocardioides alcanivorans TaxID=2897352 RepID=UPI001EEB1807|nr:mycofactocin system transcriptional regulator [Nocardioides alcanivorans]